MDNELFDIFAKEYKDLLLNKLKKENLNTQEIIEFDKKIKSQFFTQENQKRMNGKILVTKRNYRKIRISLMYIFLGIIFYLYSIIFNKLSFFEDDLLGTLFSITGLLISLVGIFSLVLLFFKEKIVIKDESDFSDFEVFKENDKTVNYALNSEVIKMWDELESAVNHINPDLNRSPIRYVLESDELSNSEKETIRDFLQLRNNIVHYSSSGTSYSNKQIKSILIEVDKIIKKIRI